MSSECAVSFAFFTSTPLVVQQPSAHRLLVVIPVRRECCSWRCDSSARVMFLTAPTSTSIKPARPGVDFVESRGAVLFEVGQQRAQLAVEILPALADSDALTQRAFAVQLEASMNASTAIRASTEIIVASPSKSTNVVPASTVSTSFIAVWILAAAGLVLFVAYLLRVRHCCLPRRGRAFEYKLVLLPRRNSGISEDFRVSIGDSSPKKSSKRRTPCRVSSFKGGKAFIERCGSDHVVPQVEGMDKQKQEEPLKDDYDGEAERDLRNHLASIQSPSPRKIAIDMYWQCRSDSTPG
ncbi:hypothetical protein F441_02632 [Phytophthora nicotianae CJ01A1]|uniref:Uncharacterized protein n=4 Tax=Phytophthora nicotianae TaxID=4792 RepID=V9FVV3_PHYNI|nr:hypothetical protein F443_02670 [Phytophthora nicotianae P1569]ETK94390.1 hypothetical protein L915_02552 [Phytophthora nicotianae]ETO83289.1 hypothetical protein F444_02671 [Phytophthora nicotianae P1976]ETP24368.1 hypothetical protein F441_02632 [Phytophthora nicotianae CJ01A1]ETL47756.1 hypothetical protein L916_02525 [Phytophthora nicotianae]